MAVPWTRCLGQQNPAVEGKHRLFSDSVLMTEKSIARAKKSNKFYDTLQNRKYNNIFTRTIARLLIRGRQESINTQPISKLEVSRSYFEKFNDRVISQINIIRTGVFDRDTLIKSTKLEKFVDNLHAMTSEDVIRRNLLFKVGSKVQPYTMAVNEEILRSKPYLTTAYFVLTPDPDNPDDVVLTIYTRDTWAIGGDVNIGNVSYVTAYDENFFGTGNKFLVKFFVPQSHQRIGFEVGYTMRNLFGTFTEVEVRVGAGATNNVAQIKAIKPFILPSDYLWGGAAGYEQRYMAIPVFDTSMYVKKQNFGLWGGYAWNLELAKGTTIYTTLLGSYIDYPSGPRIDETVNPYYYRRTTALLNVGLSRRNFFQGNMIYGYGRTEDIPYGFKFETVMGMQWSQFLGRRSYIGAIASWGDMTKIGYLDASISGGTFIRNDGGFEQAMVKVSLNQFSPLISLGRHNYLRQFFRLSGTWGFNRLWGERELLYYDKNTDVHGLNTPFSAFGHNRMAANAEVVWFTPIFLYHFRFAFFGWGDVAWLGNDRNIFSNQCASAIGIGVRVKNERLVFNNFQIRLGLILSQAPGSNYSPFQFTWEQHLRTTDFTPKPGNLMQYE